MKNLVVIAYVGSFIFSMIGIYMVLNGIEHAAKVMALGAISYATFLIKAIIEISNTKNEGVNKFIWILGLIFMGSIVGLLYIIAGRKRFVETA
ncbi:MAG: hypothetical protein RL607_1122 [Bacteroidota bacterium]|jgi:hypothetical protein